MSNDMKHKYRMFRRRSGVYFIQDNETGKQQSLRTKNKVEAETLLSASNEANRQPFLNLQIARTCHAHPGLGEAVKEAALAVDGRPIHI